MKHATQCLAFLPEFKLKMTRFPGRRSRAGFTFVELMIALTLIMIGVLGALSTQVTISRLVQTSNETRIAVTDLQAAMEELLLLPLDEIPVAGSDFAEGVPIADFDELNLKDEQIVAEYPDYTPGGEIPDPLAVTLTATWTDHRGNTRSLELSSMKTR